MAPDLRSRGGERVRPERRDEHGGEDPSGQESEALAVNHDHEMSTPSDTGSLSGKKLAAVQMEAPDGWTYF
jgi:hypothetical protein